MKKIIATLALVLGLSANSWAVPLMVDFERISSNSDTDVASQLHLSIYNSTDAFILGQSIDSNQLMFVFTNSAEIDSNVSEIYIHNGPLSSLDVVHNFNSGTTFSLDNNLAPPVFPGMNGIGFVVDGALSSDSDTQGPAPNDGIDSFSDAVGLIYTLTGGLTAVQNALSDGTLMIGLHVQAIGEDGKSDGYVNTPPDTTPVPEPGTMMLLGAGFLGLAVYTKRRKNS